MTAPTNHWKLGLFVVVAIALGMLTTIYLGTRTLQKNSVKYTSYFDEAVTGLELGAPVKFRGVTVGNVSGIGVAPDRRHVAVEYEIGVDDLKRLGLASTSDERTQFAVPPDLRAQLGSSGVTGVKYVQLDYFDPAHNPLQNLPFTPARHYVPSTDSSLKGIEIAVVRAADNLPALTQELTQTVATANRLLGTLEQRQLPEKAAATLARADALLSALQVRVEQVDTKQLSSDAHATLSSMNQALQRVNAVLARMDGDQGFIASAQRASDSVGRFAQSGFGPEWGETLRDVSDAAESLRRLLDLLEREPDMLLKGRSQVER